MSQVVAEDRASVVREELVALANGIGFDKPTVDRLKELLPEVTDLDFVLELLLASDKRSLAENAIAGRLVELLPEKLDTETDPVVLLKFWQASPPGSGAQQLLYQRVHQLAFPAIAAAQTFDDLLAVLRQWRDFFRKDKAFKEALAAQASTLLQSADGMGTLVSLLYSHSQDEDVAPAVAGEIKRRVKATQSFAVLLTHWNLLRDRKDVAEAIVAEIRKRLDEAQPTLPDQGRGTWVYALLGPEIYTGKIPEGTVKILLAISKLMA